jgi:membrane fusion protein, multidrug efflux system
MLPTEILASVHRARRQTLLAFAAVSVIGAGAIATIAFAPKAESQATAQAVPVSVATVTEQNIESWTDFSGHLEAVERVEIRPRVAGAVKAIHFREGALVHTGDLLVTIDPAPYLAEVNRAKASVASAEARLTLARSNQERAQRLWDDQAISRADVEARDNELKAAQAQLEAARAELQISNLNLSYTQVRAPVSGRVGRIEVTVGNLVASGPQAQTLTTLVSVSPIYASFDADEAIVNQTLEDLRATNRSQIDQIPVKLETGTPGDAPIEGKLQLIDNQFDNGSGTLKARAVFSNGDGKLIPGQFVRVHMGAAVTKPALLVSELAIGTDQDKRFVYVVGADKKVAYREVTLGAPVGNLRVVKSGLKAGEHVVVDGVQKVGPGTVVTAQAVPMDKVAAAPNA